MPTPRSQRRSVLAAEGLEARLCLAASLGWDGPGLGSAVLTYYVANAPSSLSQTAVNTAIRTALDAWQSVANVTFVPTTVPHLSRSIDISFRPIDGAGKVLAETYLPDDVNPSPLAGDMTFDSAERWEVGNAKGNAAFDLVQIAVHELGHALGLDHSRVASSVMYPTVSPSTKFTGLTPTDVRSIQAVYAARGTTTPTTPVPTTPTPPSTSTSTTPRPPRFPRFPRFWGRHRVMVETTRAAIR